jgi:molybdopterin synthase sulfur carrier subunit
MPKVKFTSALKRFFPSLQETVVEASSIQEVITVLEKKYPGLSTYLVDDTGKLRQHVNVFIRNELIRDRDKLSDVVQKNDEVFIFQALSGG